MTSNQLTYWRTQEEKRSNLAKEAETQRSNLAKETETQRHNISDEQIRQFANELEERGLNIRSAEDATKLAELYAKYGSLDMEKIPKETLAEIQSILGIENKTTDDSGDSFLAKAFGYGRDIWKDIIGNRGIGSLGNLF